MLQDFQKKLYQHIKAQLPESEFYTIDQLSASQIPADVGHFLSQTLARRATLEAKDLITCASPWIDFDLASAERLVADFTTQLGQNGRFPKAEFDKALVRAIDYCSQYLILPITTLATFAISNRDQENSLADIRRRAGYFLYHGTVLQSLDEFLNNADGTPITRASIESHLRKVATEEAESFGADAWLVLMDPSFSAYLIAYPNAEGMPIQMIQAFLEERGANKLAAALGSSAETVNGHLSADTLAQEIRAFLEPIVVTPAPSRPIQQESSDLPLWKQFAKGEPSDSVKHLQPEQQTEPLWKTYQAESTRPGAAVSSKSAIAPPNPSPSSPMAESPSGVPDTIQGTMQSALPAELPSKSPNTASTPGLGLDLGDALEHRDRFVKELFEGDAASFEQTLNRLSSVRSWDEASQILTFDVFRKYRIDIYSEAAILFTNAVERQVKQHS